MCCCCPKFLLFCKRTFRKYKWIFDLIKLIVYIVDVGTDINVAIDYYIQGDVVWAGLTITFVIIPLLINLIVEVSYVLRGYYTTIHWVYDVIFHGNSYSKGKCFGVIATVCLSPLLPFIALVRGVVVSRKLSNKATSGAKDVIANTDNTTTDNTNPAASDDTRDNNRTTSNTTPGNDNPHPPTPPDNVPNHGDIHPTANDADDVNDVDDNDDN
ncbi:unnamed protein product, partial [Meganyctiphanes norvegica]